MTGVVSRFTTAAEFTTTFTGEIHPFADYLALLPEDELQELADDIAANGLQHPIVLDAEGRLLDGRNRLHACERAGVEPTFTVRSDINGDENSRKKVARLIRSENNRRRNQSTGQQAASDALLLDEEGLRKDGRWARDAIHEIVNSPSQRNAMSQAGYILDHHRALLIEVAKGSIAISTAYEQVKAEQEEKAERDRRLSVLREQDSYLYGLVTDDNEAMTLDGAWAAHLENTRVEREAAERDQERRRDQATTLAQSLSRLGALTVDEARTRIRSEWDPSLSRVNPDEVTPQHMRAVAAALTALAKEWGRS